MGRTIVPGSMVGIVAAERPTRGSIWAYCSADGHVMVHRCVAVRPSGYVFQGDGNAAADPLVRPDVLIGRVVSIEHGERTFDIGPWDRVARGLPRTVHYEFRRARRLAQKVMSAAVAKLPKRN